MSEYTVLDLPARQYGSHPRTNQLVGAATLAELPEPASLVGALGPWAFAAK